MQTTPNAERYDRLTRSFHWLTVALVIFLFASAQIWDILEKGTPLRKGLQSVHISLGIALAALIVARIAWRLFGGNRLPVITSRTTHLLATLAHLGLYALLLAQVVLGFGFRWAQDEPFSFFGLFSVPAPFIIDHELSNTLGDLHETVAWAIIILSGLHACIALGHHYLLKDSTLRRMLPAGRKNLQG
jgi:cytochrome b561